jgi:hypothetical protein
MTVAKNIEQQVREALDEIHAGNCAADPKLWGPALKRYLKLMKQLTPERRRELLNEGIRIIERAAGGKGVAIIKRTVKQQLITAEMINRDAHAATELHQTRVTNETGDDKNGRSQTL